MPAPPRQPQQPPAGRSVPYATVIPRGAPNVAATVAPHGHTGSLGYFAPPIGRGSAQRASIKPRSVVPFLVISILMCLAGGVVAYLAWFGSRGPRGLGSSMALPIVGTCSFLLLAIPAVVLWLIWVYSAHGDVQRLSGGAYSITPGKALGFSFIPGFDAFWVVYMPYRLACELNRHLSASGQRTVSSGTVITCQICSVLAAVLVPGFTPVLYAISMWQVQGGLNRLATPSPA
jgi:hypothetical protein